MSASETSDEDLTQDSVPDPPRENIAETPESATGHSENTKSKKGKKESDPKSSKPSKPRRSPWRPTDFGMAQAPASTTTINIQDANNVHVGNVITVNVGEKKSKTSVKLPRKVENLMQSSETVSEDDIDTVATHTGKHWKDVGLKLGFTAGQLMHIERDSKQDGSKETVYQMLLSWKQDKDNKATLGVLCRCLWEAREYDAAKKLAKERS